MDNSEIIEWIDNDHENDIEIEWDEEEEEPLEECFHGTQN
jgi:hypothetical protein